ncbi:putative baseplate assembly protein [Chitinimonas arctica]|nr:putative baseplate assembly protein [Chitinimonas arctica]
MGSKTCGCTGCGCCEGVRLRTPARIANRPGLDAIAYRVGTHWRFLDSMKARLGSLKLEAKGPGGQLDARYTPLSGLTTRDPADAAIALLDGWACVADVLTFYQERLANEAYLRTATERRSVLELARLVGYALRPGVAASVYLAYTVDANQTTPVEIAAGARSQSIPAPDELPQSFETSETLLARAEWSNLQVRLTRPQRLTANGIPSMDSLVLAGTETGLKPNDPLLFLGLGAPMLRQVASAEADFERQRTIVKLLPSALAAAPIAISTGQPSTSTSALSILRRLGKPLSRLPALPAARSSAGLRRSLSQMLSGESDVQAQLLGFFNPAIKQHLYTAWASGATAAQTAARIIGFGVKAAPFGSTAPLRPMLDTAGRISHYEDWPLPGDTDIKLQLQVGDDGDGGTQWIFQVSGNWNGQLFQSDQSVFNEREFSLNIVTVRVTGDLDQGARVRFTFKDGLVREMALRIEEGGGTQTLHVACDGLVVDVRLGATAAAPGNRTERLRAIFRSTTEIELDARLLSSSQMALESGFEQIVPGSLALLMRDGQLSTIATVLDVATTARAAFGMTGKSTLLDLEKPWRDSAHDTTLASARPLTVFAQSHGLALAEAPIDADVAGSSIELARLYDGLESGRWIIVAGERSDIETGGQTVSGVMVSERVMIAGVSQSFDATLPGDQIRTTLQLANSLAYRYKRASLRIYGNVVKATHGETRHETLGSGDGAKPMSAFALKQPPLTFVSAPTPSGVASTLRIYVNDMAWHETDTLAGLGPRDRVFVGKTDNADITTVQFGNGEQGARPPTGVENIKAVYRNGIGRPGNVRAGQITLLQTRPLGVKEVINPDRAAGGADRESLDQARENAPMAVMALDRLVSVQDYADFARTFAGIGKAMACRLHDRGRAFIHLTIAGADDIPINPHADVYLNLLASLRRFGDPAVPVRLAVRELIVMVLSANIRLQPDYLWEPVAAAVRAALLARFGFDRQALAQSVALGQIIGLIQGVEGVAYVDVDTFDGLPESAYRAEGSGQLVRPPISWVEARAAEIALGITHPAQLAIFTPAIPDTLILNQIG